MRGCGVVEYNRVRTFKLKYRDEVRKLRGPQPERSVIKRVAQLLLSEREVGVGMAVEIMRVDQLSAIR